MYHVQLVCINGDVSCRREDMDIRLLADIYFSNKKHLEWFKRVMSVVLDYDKNEIGLYQTPQNKYTVKVETSDFMRIGYDKTGVCYTQGSHEQNLPFGLLSVFCVSNDSDDLDMARGLLSWCYYTQRYEVEYPRIDTRCAMLHGAEYQLCNLIVDNLGKLHFILDSEE